MFRTVYEKLRAIREEYEKISELADEKKQALLKNDCDALNEINEKERERVTIVARLECERMEVVASIAGTLSPETKTLTVSETVKYADPETGRMILEEAKRLLGCLKQIKEKNDFNRQLIEMNLSYTTFMLESFTKIDTPGSVYGENGSEEEYSSSRISIFDSEI